MKHVMSFAMIVCVLMLANVAVAQEGLAVVANSSVDASSLSKGEVADVFTGAKSTVGSTTVKLFILSPEQAASQVLFDKVLQTTATKFNQQWLRKTFSGGGSAPTRMTSAAEMAKAIASTPGAVGYISKSDVGSAAGCKVLYSE